MRVRLDARVDVDQLVVEARRQVDKTIHLLDEIDAVPSDDRTRESRALRGKSAERLGKAVALLEFAEMVRKNPSREHRRRSQVQPETQSAAPSARQRRIAGRAEAARDASRPPGTTGGV